MKKTKSTERAKRLADYLESELGWSIYDFGLTKKKEKKKDKVKLLAELERALAFAQKEKRP